MGPLPARTAGIKLAAATALAGALVIGGPVAAPAAPAAITASQITTPSNPSFFVADGDAGAHTLAISGTTTGGNPASSLIDLRCYFGATSVKVKGNVPLSSNGSFSVAAADLNMLLDLTCQLRAVPAGTKPADITPFAGPVIGVGDRESSKISGGANNGKTYDYSLDAQQQTGAFEYVSLGSCGLHNGFLYDSTYANTTVTFACNAGLVRADSPMNPTRSELQIDGANAYAPTQAFFINSTATGFPALSETYTVDKTSGNVVIHETDPLVKCAGATYPPTQAGCASFVSTGVTDDRTVTQDHDGHVSWITDTFESTDSKPHSIDLLWGNNQQFFGPSGNASQIEYEFPGENSFSTHASGQTVSLSSSAGTILVRMHGAADGATGTGQGAIVYDRPATAATFTSVTAVGSEFTLHQAGTVPASGSTRFRFAYVQDYQAALVATRAKAASRLFRNQITVSKSGKGQGKVTSSPGGISCGRACIAGFGYGTAVRLTPKAAKGSTFSGFSGACKGKTCKITTTDNVRVKATFALKPCKVPDVVGKTLKAAKAKIKKALCSLGKVTTVNSSMPKGHVVSESPRKGKKVKQHTKINLEVS